jgi:hypothetical protein
VANRLTNKTVALHLRIADDRIGRAVGDLGAGNKHDQALRELHHGAHDVLDQDDGNAALVQGDDLGDLDLRQARHGFVRDEEPRLRRHGAGELELAHLDLGEIARAVAGLVGKPDQLQKIGAARSELGRGAASARSCIAGVKHGHKQVFGDRQARERARQLKAARDAAARPLVGVEPVDALTVEGDQAGVIGERSADAIDQRALARSVGTDEADALAAGDLQIDAVEGDKAAEALA